jgi:hypothetical protein
VHNLILLGSMTAGPAAAMCTCVEIPTGIESGMLE